MKKLLPLFTAITFIASSAQAQDNSLRIPNKASTTSRAKEATKINREDRRAAYQDKRAEKRENYQESKENEKEPYQIKTDQRRENREKWQNSTLEEKKQILQNREGEIDEKIEQRQAKYDDSSPQQKARMEAMPKLSPEQKEQVREEMQRHRETMKRITGFELPQPPEHRPDRPPID